MNLCRVSAGLDLSEPAGTNWSSKTSIKFEVGAFRSGQGIFLCVFQC